MGYTTFTFGINALFSESDNIFEYASEVIKYKRHIGHVVSDIKRSYDFLTVIEYNYDKILWVSFIKKKHSNAAQDGSEISKHSDLMQTFIVGYHSVQIKPTQMAKSVGFEENCPQLYFFYRTLVTVEFFL